MQLLWSLLSLLAMGTSILAHINMIYPIPRGHVTLPGIPTNEIDYSITSPAQDLCQGKHARAPVQTIKAGEILNVKIEGGATHNGGYFQFSITYDHENWIVINTTDSSPLRDDKRIFPVSVPQDAPSSPHAVFHWSWINALGNREYYTNCADVKIESSGSKLTGKDLLIVNILGHPVIDEWGMAPESRYIPGLLAQRITKTSEGGEIVNDSAPRDGTLNYQIDGSTKVTTQASSSKSIPPKDLSQPKDPKSLNPCSTLGAKHCGIGSTYFVCGPLGDVPVQCLYSLACQSIRDGIACL